MATPAGVLAFADVLDGRLDEAEASIAEAAALVDGCRTTSSPRLAARSNNLACAEFFSTATTDAAAPLRAGARGRGRHGAGPSSCPTPVLDAA